MGFPARTAAQHQTQRTALARLKELGEAGEFLLHVAWELVAVAEVQRQLLEALQLPQLRERRDVHKAPAGVTFCPTW